MNINSKINCDVFIQWSTKHEDKWMDLSYIDVMNALSQDNVENKKHTAEEYMQIILYDI